MANKLYVNPEADLLFADGAQAEDVALTLTALGAGVARISARHDFGTGAVAQELTVRPTFQVGGTPVEGESVDVYASWSDGTDPDGQEGTADADVGDNDNLRNMTRIASVIQPNTTADQNSTASGTFKLRARYLSIVVHNNTTDAFKTDTGVHGVVIGRLPPELQ